MQKPTDRAAPAQPLDALLAEAENATQMFPRPERCAELNRDLRAAIGDLYLAAQERAARYPERSRDWYRVHGILEQTDMVLGADLGSGLLSAAIQLGALGRQARALANEIGRP